MMKWPTGYWAEWVPVHKQQLPWVLQEEWAVQGEGVKVPGRTQHPAVRAVPEYCILEYLAHCMHVASVVALAAMEDMIHVYTLGAVEAQDIQCLDIEDKKDRHWRHLLGLLEQGNNSHRHPDNTLWLQVAPQLLVVVPGTVFHRLIRQPLPTFSFWLPADSPT